MAVMVAVTVVGSSRRRWRGRELLLLNLLLLLLHLLLLLLHDPVLHGQPSQPGEQFGFYLIFFQWVLQSKAWSPLLKEPQKIVLTLIFWPESGIKMQ